MFSRCCWRCLRQNEKNRSFSSLLKHNFSQLIVCWVYASVSLSSLVHCYCVVHVIVTHKFCRLFPSSLYFWRQQQETSTLFAIETRLASRSEWQIRCKRRQNKRSLSLSLSLLKVYLPSSSLFRLLIVSISSPASTVICLWYRVKQHKWRRRGEDTHREGRRLHSHKNIVDSLSLFLFLLR